jgi:hypothetical protein
MFSLRQRLVAALGLYTPLSTATSPFPTVYEAMTPSGMVHVLLCISTTTLPQKSQKVPFAKASHEMFCPGRKKESLGSLKLALQAYFFCSCIPGNLQLTCSSSQQLADGDIDFCSADLNQFSGQWTCHAIKYVNMHSSIDQRHRSYQDGLIELQEVPDAQVVGPASQCLPTDHNDSALLQERHS